MVFGVVVVVVVVVGIQYVLFGRHISATNCPRVMKIGTHLPYDILHNYFFQNFEFPFFLVFLAFFDFSYPELVV